MAVVSITAYRADDGSLHEQRSAAEKRNKEWAKSQLFGIISECIDWQDETLDIDKIVHSVVDIFKYVSILDCPVGSIDDLDL